MNESSICAFKFRLLICYSCDTDHSLLSAQLMFVLFLRIPLEKSFFHTMGFTSCQSNHLASNLSAGMMGLIGLQSYLTSAKVFTVGADIFQSNTS
mmetsp:Transcript_18660/g.34574  ORF Transcript_18660/g.34574 Transcript_18660/m.34574 type:complete len:95 (-) Transcript_18660:615-899(-)